MKNRRSHFLVDKPLQFRYMAYVTITLVIISAVSLGSLYMGIWSSVLNSFSNPYVYEDMMQAARMSQYDQARFTAEAEAFPQLVFQKQVQKMGARQREIFKFILDDANKKMAVSLGLLFLFIALGSIFVSHKVAGPLYRFHSTLLNVQKGDFTTRVDLRKFDEAKTLADDFNRTITYLDVHTSRLKSILRDQKDNPEKLAEQLSGELSKIKTSVDK